jgi:hypothetical protein
MRGIEMFFLGGGSAPLASTPSEAARMRRDQERENAAYRHALLAELGKALASTPCRQRRPNGPAAASSARSRLSPAQRQMMRGLDAIESRMHALQSHLADAAVDQQLEKLSRVLEDSRPPLPIWKER